MRSKAMKPSSARRGVDGSIAARLDRLEEKARGVAIGRNEERDDDRDREEEEEAGRGEEEGDRSGRVDAGRARRVERRHDRDEAAAKEDAI